MTDAHTTFEELQRLLSRLPGVSVESVDISPKGLSMTLCIGTLESVAQVAYCANGANIPVEVWSVAMQEPIQGHSDPRFLRYNLPSLSAHGGAEKALDRFMMFGNFLTWHLHAAGAIPAVEANRVLTLWNGRRVAA